ncbi:MAG: hypothetical protein ABSH00_18590 [Bryobacteraceae bacterium]
MVTVFEVTPPIEVVAGTAFPVGDAGARRFADGHRRTGRRLVGSRPRPVP